MLIIWCGMSSMPCSITWGTFYSPMNMDSLGFSAIASVSSLSGSITLYWAPPMSNWYFYSVRSNFRAFLIRRRDLTISIILISLANCSLAISISCILLAFLQHRQRHRRNEGSASCSHSQKLKNRVGLMTSWLLTSCLSLSPSNFPWVR